MCDQVQDWSGYDVLKIDAFNPQDAPVMLSMELYDAQTRGYWTRVNYTTVLPPGNSTVALSTDIFVGEKGRPGRPLFKSKITRMILAPAKYPVTFDNIRLERLDTASVLFNGLEAFHFGLPTSPHMPGYQSVTADTSYAAGRGYGWKGGSRRAFDGLQPDSLFQAFVATSDGSFQVDLPSGKYHVIMNIDSPGGFWGEVQQYTHRTVSVNGKAAVDEKMTMADFQKSYFRNAHKEDPPGLDTFEQYVQAMFNVKQFDIDVTDGKALFDFKADGRWGITLSAMVIYPQAKASEGQKFWDWTTSQRRTQFNNYFKQVVPKGTGDKPPAQGYAVFSRGYSQLPNGNDGPRPQDAIGNEGLSCSIAKGDEEPIVFAVQPGESLGQVALQMSDFVGPGGAKLDPKTFQPGWIDYRITRVTMDGAVYSVAPRYWHPLPAPAANATRNFWIRTKLVGQAAPGKYVGKITIKPKTGPVKDLPLTITVLPFTLEPVKDVAVGPFGCSIGLPWGSEDPQTVQWNERMFGKVLDALHDDGFSTLTGLPHISFQAAGGKVVPNFTQADKEMKALRDRGFDQMICSYGANLSKDDGSPLYQMYGTESGPDEAAAKAAGFADMESFLKAIYAPIEEHAKANNWLPIAWNLSDEPIGDAARASGRNAAVHDKVAKELGLKYQTFTGATSMAGDDPKDEHYGLVTGLSMPMLNDHDDASLKLILSKGHKVALYNLDTRWCYGRYMKAMVVKYGLMYRVNWHLNVVAGDPYYALDCREDDYCWYNTDENQALVPSLALLASTMPGVNDYRYLSTLERLLKEKADAPAAAQAKKVFEEQVNLVAGKDRSEPKDPAQYQADRNKVIAAILALLEK